MSNFNELKRKILYIWLWFCKTFRLSCDRPLQALLSIPGYGVVRLGKGEYKITKTIHVPSNKDVIGG